MRFSIGAFVLTAAAVAAAALLAVSKPEGGSAAPYAAAGAHLGASAASPNATSSSAAAPIAPPSTVTRGRQYVNLEIRTNEVADGEEQPRYVPAGATAASLKGWKGNITVRRGETVVLSIVNHDDGSAELQPGYRKFDTVQGGAETVDGVTMTSVPNGDVAHTFTSIGLGVNAAIPAAPEGGTNRVVLTFTPKKAGSFAWTCFAPCGTGSGGLGDAMDAPSWMEGTITVLS